MAVAQNVKSIDTQAITDKARRDLLQLLEKTRGKKNLVIEKSLAGTIGLFVKFSELQAYGVEKVFFLENQNVDSSQRNVVFLVRGENAKKTRMVAEQIKLIRSESQIDHVFHVIWVPRRTRVSDIILEEHGVLGEAVISQLPLHFIPLEQDLLSLELDDAFSDLYLRKDPTTVFASATALMLLQQQYGLFPRILGKGENAKRLADLLRRMRREDDVDNTADSNVSKLTSFSITPSPLVESLIVIDREVDFPTVLSTQLTYEGLIDESFGIENNQAEVPSEVLGGVPPPRQDAGTPTAPAALKKTKIPLDSSEKLFPSLRDANFATIGPSLQRIARRLQAEEQTMHNKDQTIADLRNTVSNLSTYKLESASLKLHTSLAEQILTVTSGEIFSRMLETQQNLLAGADPSGLHENIEELVYRGVSIKTTLRLLCLESCLSGGIRQRELDNFKRIFLNAYGFQHLITLTNLEKMGLLVPREGHRGYFAPMAGNAGSTATDWSAVRKALATWVDDVAEDNPTDLAYVFSGYAPLTVRLVQSILPKTALQPSSTFRPAAPAPAPPASTAAAAESIGWSGFTDTLGRIRGDTVDTTQKGSDAAVSAARKTLRGARDGPQLNIVFFLGGVTYAEIAALRLLNQQMAESSGRKIIIATTGIIGGNKCIEAAIENRKFGE